MERLTKKMKDKDGKEKFVAKAEFLSNPREYTNNIINRLGEYEELEESGLLLRLPCKVEQIEKELIGECAFLTPEEIVRKALNVFLGMEG